MLSVASEAGLLALAHVAHPGLCTTFFTGKYCSDSSFIQGCIDYMVNASMAFSRGVYTHLMNGHT